MLISLACITKNEEDMIDGLLTSVRGLVDEAVVVDTGSTDNTMAKATELGARVIRSNWQGSFSVARNESLKHCRGDWIIFLDADERVTGNGFKTVRRMLTAAKEDGFYVTLINYTDLAMQAAAENIKLFRVFRNRPEYRFTGSIHEQIMPELISRGRSIGLLPLEVAHLGYVAGVIQKKNKLTRNLTMCEEVYRLALPGSPGAFYSLFNLAREYQNGGNLVRAVEMYTGLLQNKQVHNEPYFAIAAYNVCACLAMLPGREQTALDLVDGFLAVMADYPELWYLRGTFQSRLQMPEEALSSFFRVLSLPVDSPRYISRMPRLREKTWLEVARIKKAARDKPGYLASLHKFWEENPALNNADAILEIVRLLLVSEKPVDIVQRYLFNQKGMETELWLLVREVFLLQGAFAGALEISDKVLKPRNRSLFQFLRNIDECLAGEGPVDSAVLRNKGLLVAGDSLLRPTDWEVAALLFLAAVPEEMPWHIFRGIGEGEEGLAVRQLTAYYTGQPTDQRETVNAVYLLVIKFRRLTNPLVREGVKKTLLALGEQASVIEVNFRRIDAMA